MNNLPLIQKILIYSFIGVVFIALIVAFIFFNKRDNETVQVNPTEQLAQLEASPDLAAELLPQNNSGQMGEVSFNSADNQTRVRIFLETFPQNITQPAHIHTGSCLNIGEVLYPLNNVYNGESETIIEASLDDLESQKPLAVNVHKSEEESQIYVSCADLWIC